MTAAQLLERARQARSRRDAQAARAALLEVRQRFPSDAAAEEATFLLGRIELELAQRPERAIDWFEDYVERYPHGRFAAQARGRIVHHRMSHGTPQQAARAASEYLEHHPSGPYIGLARQLLDGSTPSVDADVKP